MGSIASLRINVDPSLGSLYSWGERAARSAVVSLSLSPDESPSPGIRPAALRCPQLHAAAGVLSPAWIGGSEGGRIGGGGGIIDRWSLAVRRFVRFDNYCMFSEQNVVL